MREPQHEPAVEIGKTQKVTELCESGWSWPIANDLDLCWMHMHPPFINNVSQICVATVFGEYVRCGEGALPNSG